MLARKSIEWKRMKVPKRNEQKEGEEEDDEYDEGEGEKSKKKQNTNNIGKFAEEPEIA